MLSMSDAGCVGAPVERRQSRIYMVREPFNEPRTGTPPRGASDPPGDVYTTRDFAQNRSDCPLSHPSSPGSPPAHTVQPLTRPKHVTTDNPLNGSLRARPVQRPFWYKESKTRPERLCVSVPTASRDTS